MYRDLLVPVVLGATPREAIAAACALAPHFDGTVIALVAINVQTPPVMAWNYFPEGAYESLREAARAMAETTAQDVRAQLASCPVPSETRIDDATWLSASLVAVAHARHADLVVLGRTPQALPEAERALFADLLLDSGRPVLLVPPGCQWPQRLERIVVAWRAGPEASRAVHDALPLLKLVDAVELVLVEPGVGPAGGESPGAGIVAHLARHGITTTATVIAREGRTTGEALLHHAQATGAQLIVAGGYGHSRAREMIFGGVTRTLFRQEAMPVLFSH